MQGTRLVVMPRLRGQYSMTQLPTEQLMNTPQIAYKVTAYKVDSAYKVGFCWNQIILGIFIVIIDLILSIYCVAC